jgi:3-oxoacyl-(acyl-carrier-protein) synthase
MSQLPPSQRVVVTGLGVVHGLGQDPTTFWNSLAAGKNGAADRVQVLFEGLGESMSTPILGFALLALSALGVAVGMRRLGAE